MQQKCEMKLDKSLIIRLTIFLPEKLEKVKEQEQEQIQK